MFKSIALKMSAAVLGILSISFSGVINDALKVDAGDNPYDSNLPRPVLGLFDDIDYSNRLINLQTGYFTLTSDLDWLSWGPQYGTHQRFAIQHFFDGANSFHGVTYDRGLGASNSFSWVTTSAVPTPSRLSAQGWFLSRSGSPAGYSQFAIDVPLAWLATPDVAGFKAYLDEDPIDFQYAAVSVYSSISFDDYFSDYPSPASIWSEGHEDGYSEGYFDGYDAGEDVGESRGYDNGRSVGYSEGYSSGYSVGYSEGFAAMDGLQYINIVNDGQYAFIVRVYDSSSEYPIFYKIVEVGDSAVYTRNPGVTCHFKFESVQQDWPYFGFSVDLDGANYVLNNSMIVNDYIYMPTWYKNMTIRAFANNNNQFTSQFDGLMFSPSDLESVYIGDNTFVRDAYSEGYDAGQQDGYEEGANSGRSEGYSYGYASGYSDGNRIGYNSGYNAGGGDMQVIDIWPLMGAVVTMPFTFFSQGLDWTLFEGSPYEFGVSMFFGSVLVILMLWKILQLVIGLGK